MNEGKGGKSKIESKGGTRGGGKGKTGEGGNA